VGEGVDEVDSLLCFKRAFFPFYFGPRKVRCFAYILALSKPLITVFS
jgi:hypothetical protein